MASLFGKLKRAVAADDEEKATEAPPKKQKTETKPKQTGGQGRRLGDLRKLRGKAAILFTCPTRMERKACHEAWELLSEKVDEEQESSQKKSLAASLKAEARASKASKVATYDLGSQGVGWATVDGVDVVELATRLVRDASEDPASLAAGSRMVIRIMPMQSVTFASLSDLVEGAAPLISQLFGGLRTSPHRAIVEALEALTKRDEELLKTAREKAAAESGTEPGSASSVKYAVRLQRRSAAGFPKDAAVRALAALVPPQHTVSLGAPEVTILVEVFKSLCGVAVVPGYHTMHDFNLHAAAGKQVVPPPPKSKKK